MKTRVKICGVRRGEDARFAARLGADAVGAVFIAGSPREVAMADVPDLFDGLPPFVSRAGLFRNPERDFVQEACRRGGLSLLQFHGQESDQYCAQFGIPYIKAINGDRPEDILAMHSDFPSSVGYVIDSVSAGEGGTGRLFDWNNWPMRSEKPLILAGGLNPENVAKAVATLRPWGVDVSSGVEDGVKGVKSRAKMREFIENARSQVIPCS